LNDAITFFTQKHSLKPSVVKRIAAGQFTFLHETVPGQIPVTAASEVTELNVLHLATAAEKKHIPSQSSEFSVAAEVLLEGRALFAPLAAANDVVFDISQDRAWASYFYLWSYLLMTALGVHLYDCTIRQYCAVHGRAIWPPPWEIATELSGIMNQHRLPSLSPHCLTCGQMAHTVKSCPERMIFHPTKAIKQSQARSAIGAILPPQQANFVQACSKFMAKPFKTCKSGSCQFSHKCTVCQGNGSHNKGCSR
jgi:hypothetical protein